MAKSHPFAGQFNLKGKKYKRCGCGCCSAENIKPRLEDARIKRELKELIIDE